MDSDCIVSAVSTDTRQPKMIHDPKTIAVAFARVVTTRAGANSIIARKGDSSLFAVFSRVFPEVHECEHPMNNKVDKRFLCRYTRQVPVGGRSQERLEDRSSTNMYRKCAVFSASVQGEEIFPGESFPLKTGSKSL